MASKVMRCLRNRNGKRALSRFKARLWVSSVSEGCEEVIPFVGEFVSGAEEAIPRLGDGVNDRLPGPFVSGGLRPPGPC